MLPWRFVGRTDELSLLTAAVAGTTGRGLIVAGPAGVGKSSLLREGIAALPPEQFAIVTAHASVPVAALPLGCFAHVLPADQPGGLSPSGLLRWAITALRHQAAGRRIVVAIDDIHLVDALSAALITIVARSEQATVLATLHSDAGVPDRVTALWTDDVLERIELGPLTAHEVTELLTHVLGESVDAVGVQRLHRLSTGNPLLLRELLLAPGPGSDLVAAGHPTGSEPHLNEIIDGRIGQLGDGAREVLELVAFGEPVGRHLLCAIAGAGPVTAAEEHQLIVSDQADRRTSVRPAHPLYGEIARERCRDERRRSLLVSLAETVERAGARRRDDLMRVALWRLESRTASDPAPLLIAGGQAFAALDLPLALRLAHAARASGGGFDAAVLLAPVQLFASQPTEALAVLDEVRSELSTSSRASRWHSLRATIRYWGLGLQQAPDDLAAAAETLSDPDDLAWVNAFESLMRLHQLRSDASLRLAHAVLDRPAASAGARALARGAIAHLQALRGQTTQADRTVAAAEAESAHWRPRTPQVQLALDWARFTNLILSGRVDGLQAGATEFAEAGQFRFGAGYLSIVLGQSARLRGRLAESLRHLRTACDTLGSSRVAGGLAYAEWAHTAALRGDALEATQAMAEADRRYEATMAVLYPWLEQARYWVLVSAGDRETAVTRAQALARRLRADSLHGHEAIVLHDLVRLGRAERVVDRLSALVATTEGLTELMATHARAATERDPSGLLAVADRFAGLGLRLLAAEAAASAFNRLRQTRSRRVVDAARVFGDLVDSCEGARTPGLMVTRPTLSARERQIAQLAATGVTSRDIAERLFLSIRTVDNHLRRVYAKLDVSGRGSLREALRALADGDDWR